MRSYLSYTRSTEELCFWRSTHQYEVDFLIGDQSAIETKVTKRVTSRDLKGLQILQEEAKFKRLYLVSQDKIEAKYGNIFCLHWETFMSNYGQAKLSKKYYFNCFKIWGCAR